MKIDDIINKVHCADCLTFMQDFPDRSVDLVLMDPPYGVTQNKWDVMPDLQALFKELWRISKENTAIIMTSQQPFTTDLISNQRKFFRYDIIWYKALGTGFLNANKMPMRNHEHILVFYKNLPIYNPQMGVGIRKKGMRKHDRTGTNYGNFATEGTSNYFDDKGERFPQSVIDFTNGDRTKENQHPTQKPLSLITYFIQTYSNKGCLILDPFFGSGTLGVACKELGRKFIGIEISEEYCSIARQRLDNTTPCLL